MSSPTKGRPTRGLSTTDPVSLIFFTIFPIALCVIGFLSGCLALNLHPHLSLLTLISPMFRHDYAQGHTSLISRGYTGGKVP
jgi:hypothetical protein